MAAVEAVQRDAVDVVSTAWLIGIARHKLVDHWRRTERRSPSRPRRRRRPDRRRASGDDPWDVHVDVLVGSRHPGAARRPPPLGVDLALPRRTARGRRRRRARADRRRHRGVARARPSGVPRDLRGGGPMTVDPFDRLHVLGDVDPDVRPDPRFVARLRARVSRPAPSRRPPGRRPSRTEYHDDRHRNRHRHHHGHPAVHLRQPRRRGDRVVPRRVRRDRDDPLHRRRRPHRPRRDQHRRGDGHALRSVPRARRACRRASSAARRSPCTSSCPTSTPCTGGPSKAAVASTGEPEDESYGARSFSMIDPFGHRWMVQTPIGSRRARRSRRRRPATRSRRPMSPHPTRDRRASVSRRPVRARTPG